MGRSFSFLLSSVDFDYWRIVLLMAGKTRRAGLKPGVYIGFDYCPAEEGSADVAEFTSRNQACAVSPGA
jgi:hypothetical protein